VEAGEDGINPLPAIVKRSLASKMGMPREFKRKTDADFTFAPIFMSRPSLVVMVIDESVFSTLTHPPCGMPATAATSSTIFSNPVVSYGIFEFGSVVDVVIGVVVVVTIDVEVVGAIVDAVVVGGDVVVVVFDTITGTVVVVGELVGTAEVGGAVVSMTIGNEALCVEVLPATSVAIADTAHVPSLSVGKLHVVATAVSYVQVTVIEPFVAETVTTSPEPPPPIPIAGVLSEVLLSVEEDPSSEVASRSGVFG
jgi:hypothetical protein